MPACPFCASELVPSTQGPGERCTGCDARWLAGPPLFQLLTEDVVRPLIAEATLNARKRCRSCHAGFTGDGCGRCGGHAVRCPSCDLPVKSAQLRALTVELCRDCEGMLLDPGELKQLKGQQPARGKGEQDLSSAAFACAGCRKPLLRRHAFENSGAVYCGSCAPPESAALEGQLTPGITGDSSTVARDVSVAVAEGLLEVAFGVLVGVLFD